MRRTLFIIAMVIALLPYAYSQSSRRRPNTPKPPTAQPAEATQAAPENSVAGSLTFNGKTVALPYVYAKSGAVNYNPGIHLYFTDRPIVEAVAEDKFQAKAKNGEVNGIYVRLDAATKRPIGYEIGINKEYLLVYNYDYSRAQKEGFSGEIFNLTTPNPALLQGTISANRTTDRLDVKSSLDNPRTIKYVYQFNLTFKAQLKKDAWTGNFGVDPPVNLEPGRAEGEMIDKGQKKKLNYVRARMEGEGFDDKSRLVLTFTEQPISQGSPGKEHTPYLRIRINPKTMAVVGSDIMRANGNDSFASSVHGNEFTIRNGKTLEGRFIFAGSYKVACKALIEADSEAPVTARAGKALPRGGGEAGRAFVEYMTALENAKTFEEAMRVIKNSKASMTEEAQAMDETKLKAATDKQKKDMFEFVRTFYVIADVKITGGFINKDQATLNVVGVQDKDEVKGEVNMHLEGGQWKVGKTSVSPTGKFVRPTKPAVNPTTDTAAKNVVMAKSNGTVAGTFSVDGKPVNLKYLYALRRAANPPMTGPAIELFLTDQPVPEAILKTIAAKEMRLFYLLEDYFKGTSIKGIYFWVGKGSGKPDYFQTLIAPESYQLDLKEFTSFTIQKGKLQAKAADKGEKGGIRWNYALDLNATLEALASPTGLPDTAVAGSPIGVPPDEGKASGSIEMKGSKSVKLNLAYAWRERRFFDEPDETIYVLATESPVVKEKALFADLSKLRELGEQGKLRGVVLTFEATGAVWGGAVFVEAVSLGDFSGRPAVSEFKIENGRVKGKAEYKSDDKLRTYTVTFDAPLKN